jgi:hypothetical protein
VYSSFDLDREYLLYGAALHEVQMASTARREESADLLSGGRRGSVLHIEVL